MNQVVAMPKSCTQVCLIQVNILGQYNIYNNNNNINAAGGHINNNNNNNIGGGGPMINNNINNNGVVQRYWLQNQYQDPTPLLEKLKDSPYLVYGIRQALKDLQNEKDTPQYVIIEIPQITNDTAAVAAKKEQSEAIRPQWNQTYGNFPVAKAGPSRAAAQSAGNVINSYPPRQYPTTSSPVGQPSVVLTSSTTYGPYTFNEQTSIGGTPGGFGEWDVSYSFH